MKKYTECRWNDDRCQHGYWVDDSEVKFYPAAVTLGMSYKTKNKYLCPKGQTTRQEV